MLLVGLLLTGLCLLVSANAFADSDVSSVDEPRTGFILGLNAGWSVGGAFASDDLLLYTSPTFVEKREGSVAVTGYVLGWELGWGITPDYRITWDTHIVPFVAGGDLAAQVHVVFGATVFDALSVRIGAGITAVEAKLSEDFETTAGPGRTAPAHGEETISGVGLSVLAGLEYDHALTSYFSFVGTLDGVFSVLSLGDAPEERFTDTLFEGAQLSVTGRFYF